MVEGSKKEEHNIILGRINIACLSFPQISNIAILTYKTEKISIISDTIADGAYKRKFKGAQADAILLIDVYEVTFNPDSVLL